MVTASGTAVVADSTVVQNHMPRCAERQFFAAVEVEFFAVFLTADGVSVNCFFVPVVLGTADTHCVFLHEAEL